MIGDYPEYAKRHPGGWTCTSANRRRHVKTGRRSPYGCSWLPALTFPRPREVENAWKRAHHGRKLLGGRSNGKCRVKINNSLTALPSSCSRENPAAFSPLCQIVEYNLRLFYPLAGFLGGGLFFALWLLAWRTSREKLYKTAITKPHSAFKLSLKTKRPTAIYHIAEDREPTDTVFSQISVGQV